MTWSGRKLMGLTLTDNTAVSYTYNADGIRTEKTVGARHTEYLLDGTKGLKHTTTDVSSSTTEQILFYYHFFNSPFSLLFSSFNCQRFADR